MPRTTLYFLPGLGLDAAAGGLLDDALGADVDLVGVDLPGFGDTPATGGDVRAAVRHVEAVIARTAPGRWGLVGHSMGGKIATVVAARALAGESGLFGLAGVVLLAGSPPSPEPIDDARRHDMLGWTAGPGRGLDAGDARRFLDANTAAPLGHEAETLALAGLARTDHDAWTAWLTRGSLEDWSERVGELPVPALLLAGAEDGDLDADAQRRLNLPHYPRGRVEVVPQAAHLLMLEQPGRVAAAIREWWAATAGTGPQVPGDYARMLASPRTSRRTRAALARRILADDPHGRPQVLDAVQLETLRALADLVVPQGGAWIDLAARIDTQLAEGAGDGWRHADAPPDPEAYRRGLDALSGLAEESPHDQARRLRGLDETDDPATAAWWADVRTDLVRHWLAHPATMARIGFDGVAGGGDDDRKQGFVLLEAGRREAWEPAMVAAAGEDAR